MPIKVNGFPTHLSLLYTVGLIDFKMDENGQKSQEMYEFKKPAERVSPMLFTL